jgi:hypothetical protein
MSVLNSKPEEKPENQGESCQQSKRKWCITLGIILLIEFPQVMAAWVTLADRMAWQLPNPEHPQVIEVKKSGAFTD